MGYFSLISLAFVLLVGCQRDTVDPSTITSFEYVVTNTGFLTYFTTLRVTPTEQSFIQQQSYVYNKNHPPRCTEAITQQEWKALIALYDHKAFKTSPPDASPKTYAGGTFPGISVTIAGQTQHTDDFSAISPLAKALHERFEKTAKSCP